MGLFSLSVSSLASADSPPGSKGLTLEVDEGKQTETRAREPLEKPAYEQAKSARGVVVIERAGQTIGLGFVLSGDGRVLTALSPLGYGNDLEARFQDNSTVKVKLGHHDRAWDLALLVPQSGKWKDGLSASQRSPYDAHSAPSYAASRGKAAPSRVSIRGKRTILGADDRPLESAIELGSRVGPTDLGAPLLDEEGRVLGIIGRGCTPKPNRPCAPVAFGVPMSTIRAFLRSVPETAVAPPAWLGIQASPETVGIVRGVRVTLVHPNSPAEIAKLRGGDTRAADLIVAVDGTPVGSPEQLAELIRAHSAGETIPLLVFAQGKYRQVAVTLTSAPDAADPGQEGPAKGPEARMDLDS